MPRPEQPADVGGVDDAASLSAAVRDLMQWRERLTDTTSPSGMLLQLGEAMRREEEHWRQRHEASVTDLRAAENELAAALRAAGVELRNPSGMEDLAAPSGGVVLSSTQDDKGGA